MSEQTVPAITSLITSVDFDRKDLDLQDFIDAVKRGEVRRPLTDWIASYGWVNTELPFIGDFDPACVGEGWKVLTDEDRGTGIILSRVRFETYHEKYENTISGEVQLQRLKGSGDRPLGGKSFKTCWDGRDKLPKNWRLDRNGMPRIIFFDGLILLSPSGNRHTLFMYLSRSQWNWGYKELRHYREAIQKSAVLGV